MRRNLRHDTSQPELAGLGLPVARAGVVVRLMRWSAELVRVQGVDGRRVCGGELVEVGYSDWLAFYSPLCSNGGHEEGWLSRHQAKYNWLTGGKAAQS